MKQYVHYINNGKGGIYGKDVFIDEAKKIGVNRAFPPFMAKKFKFGEKIYTAIYSKDPTKPNKERWIDGTADVFGYFVIDSINIVGDIKQVYHNLGIVPQPSNTQIVRSCGTYTVAYICDVKGCPIEEIIKECEKLKLTYKVMIGGKFYECQKKLSPINFSRSFVIADFPDDYSQAIEQCINELRQLTNYIKT